MSSRLLPLIPITDRYRCYVKAYAVRAIFVWMVMLPCNGQGGVVFSIQQIETEATRLMLRGNDSRNAGQPDLALSQYVSAYILTSQLPDSAEVTWRLYTSLTTVLDRMHAYSLAIVFAKRTFAAMALGHSAPPILRCQSLGYTATLYQRNNQSDSAGHFFAKALQMAQTLPLSSYAAAGAYNNMGMLYASQHKPHAIQCYEKALELTRKQDAHAAFQLAVWDNIAEYRLLFRQNQAALSTCAEIRAYLATFGATRISQEERERRFIKTRLKEAKAYSETGQFATAIAILQTLENRPALAKNLPFRLELGRQMGSLSVQVGDLQQALRYEKQVETVQDTLLAQQKRYTSLAAQSIVTLRTHTLEREMESVALRAAHSQLLAFQAAERAVLNRWLAILSLLSAFGALGGGYVLYRRRVALQQQRAELEKTRRQLAQIQLQQTQTNLQHRQGDLSDVMVYMTDIRGWQAQLLEDLHACEQADEQARPQLLRQIRNDLRNRLSIDERLQLIQDNIGVINRAFYERLSAQYPNLTPAEIELCGYICLNLSTKDIAALKNVTPKAVEMGRYRLRKKMGIDSDSNISAILQESQAPRPLTRSDESPDS